MDVVVDEMRLLLDRTQREFPLTPRPFADIAAGMDEECGGDGRWSEARVIALFNEAHESGALSRIGPVFAAHGIGASTLAALAAPAAELQAVADWVSALPQVNHNYRRSHDYNLWFVVTGRDEADVQATLDGIRAAWPRLPLLDLPLVNAFYIDLGFALDDGAPKPACGSARAERRHELTAREWQLVALVQEGLPLVPAPYAAIAAQWGAHEGDVIATLRRWLDAGIVKRYGTVVRHRELGYRANAMCVFDVPDADVAATGRLLAGAPEVRLCYQRRRADETWPYNLFCMVHGSDRDGVLAMVRGLTERLGLSGLRHHVLIGERRYKQRGAWYAPPPTDSAGSAGCCSAPR